MSGFREARVAEVMREQRCSYFEACRELQRRAVRCRMAKRARSEAARLTVVRESWAARWEREKDER